MTSSSQKPKTAKQGDDREDRLKAALKANLARRKAQSKARSGQTEKNLDKTED